MGVKRPIITKEQKRAFGEFFIMSLNLSWLGRFKIRRRILYKTVQIAIISTIVLSAVQFASCTLFEGNFFESVINWTKGMIISLAGNKFEEDEHMAIFANAKEYDSVKEFYETEGIEIIVPEFMPNDLKVQKVIYLEDNSQIRIKYSDDIKLYIILNDNLVLQL